MSDGMKIIVIIAAAAAFIAVMIIAADILITRTAVRRIDRILREAEGETEHEDE